jgi:hypothetical protein
MEAIVVAARENGFASRDQLESYQLADLLAAFVVGRDVEIDGPAAIG